MRCAIHSAENGSLMVIPRENKLVRLYIQLKEVAPDASGRADRSKITPELIFGAAQKILSPYKIEYEYCDWWTAYQVSLIPGAFHNCNGSCLLTAIDRSKSRYRVRRPRPCLPRR